MSPRHLLAVLLLALGAGPAAAQTFREDGLRLLGSLAVGTRSASWADIDNDGDPDLLFQGAIASRRLLRNNSVGLGEDSFTDITSTHGPSAPDTTGWSAAWGDYDDDGWVDVFLGEANIGSARGDLFRNRGVLGFLDVSATTINDPGFHQSVAWADIDNDGDLDLLIAMEGPERHEIYLQGPAGVFTAVGAQVGFQVDHGTKAYGMAIGDYDGDGDLDIYISTCNATNPLRNNFFENRLIPDGHLHFVDVADTNGTQNMPNSYAAEFADIDDDGDLDLFLVGADGFPSKIFINNGDGTFTNAATLLGRNVFSNSGRDLNGARLIDYDNDGDLDVFFHDQQRAVPELARLLFRNDGGWVFTDVTVAEGLSSPFRGAYDSAWADYDLDGDLDLAAPSAHGFRDEFFVSNASTNGNHWLYIHLRQPPPNSRAIGAQLYATIHEGTERERTLRRDANTNAGAFNQNDLPVHFGLGDAEQIDRLRIRWPNGAETVFTNVTANQHLTLTPGPTASDGWVLY
ncbi:MAG: CRTAC1 family protein [Candidatus Sumerlaeia bacterium]|nr:CRTAC1 family protein [Candidatus Sumerlaeia bacterium]